ncbi:MAG: hypothetical protein HYV60_03545 [Planctomycetia bacterium]|nr:hypothetical protein [Planctomycetia bacterium]
MTRNMSSINNRYKRLVVTRAASLLALAGVLVSSLGIMFVPAVPRSSSQAFPCQGGHCGCSTAAQCWQSCCCTSVSERLAWAKANDVTPPAFLSNRLADSKARPKPAKPIMCCSHATIQSGDAESCATEREGEPLVHFVSMSELNGCRGLSKYIAIFGAAICKPLPDALAFDFTPSLWLRTLDDSFESPLPAPPTPPPRVLA